MAGSSASHEQGNTPGDQARPGQIALRMQGISKRFPGVVANDGVNFIARSGEIHALLGENGAGKSTLMCIAGGQYLPEAGTVEVFGRSVLLRSPRDAIRLGIGMVHQHFMLVPSLTVAENVVLGLREPRFLLQSKKIEELVRSLGERWGLLVDPAAPVWQLSVGEQQRVEILKLLIRGAGILILDEPTAVLAPSEARDLLRALRQMAQGGSAVVLISHKLDEVLEVSDRFTILRRGKVVAGDCSSDGVTREGLARQMVGRTVLFEVGREPNDPGPVRLEFVDVFALSDRGTPALRGVSLTVRAGEIVGIAGVAGNGQRELAEVITGLRRVDHGTVRLQGRETTGESPLARIRDGVGYVPEDRNADGIVGTQAVANNLILKAYREAEFSRWGLIDGQAVSQHAERMVVEFDIGTHSIAAAAGGLSGGNAQKLILAREFSAKPKVLVAAQPTRGLDISATEAVHGLLMRARRDGVAILLISEDLDELLSVSDRVVVLYGGRVAGEFASAQATAEELGPLMVGGQREPTS